jgi:nucleoside-diphosphate-sugar epimerase
MSKRLAEQTCEAWTGRTGIPAAVLRPVMMLGDETLTESAETAAELGAFVHVDDVAAATALALQAEVPAHVRLTLCGPGAFDTTAATRLLGWRPERTWPARNAC